MVGIDTIPPKLIKLMFEFPAPSFTAVINFCIENIVFPNNPKVAPVALLDKVKANKNDASNARSVRLFKHLFKDL